MALAGQRSVRIGDLPDDVQVLVGDFIDEFSADEAFTVFDVPVDAFPVVRAKDLDASRGRAHAAEMRDPALLPPVLLYGSKWLDGMHRVYAARLYGRATVPAIDLAERGHSLVEPSPSLLNATIPRRKAPTVVDCLVDGGLSARALLEAPQYYGAPVAYMRDDKFGRISPNNFDSYELLGSDSNTTYVVNPHLTLGFAFASEDVGQRPALGLLPVMSLMLRDSGYKGYRQAYRLRIRKSMSRAGTATNWYLLFVQRYGGIVSDAEHLEGGRLLWRSLVDKAEVRGFRASLLHKATGDTKPVSSQTPDSEIWSASPSGRDLLLVLER